MRKDNPDISSAARSLPEKVNIFLTVSPEALKEHFNKNDPAPIYKRQLSQPFEKYIRLSTAPARRYTTIQYMVTYDSESDKELAEPLIYALKRHFTGLEISKKAEFERFKRRNYLLLLMGLSIIMLAHITIPLFLKDEGGVQTALITGLDIFCWVMMWQPIDKLLFHWNSYLKEINTFNKLTVAEVIYSEDLK